MKKSLEHIDHLVLGFLEQHLVETEAPFAGLFSLYPRSSAPDLYGMLDAAYILQTIGGLADLTDKSSRETWAERILACQDDQGWFSRKNLRGHSLEHATAYAIGALLLLELESDERYVKRIKPLEGMNPLLSDAKEMMRWLRRLDFRITPQSILQKKLGWHYIWRGSHVGGGIPAAVGMTKDLIAQWWPGQVDVNQWFEKYFDWLDCHVNAGTGYWQRAFWNYIYRKPTLIDMGGAVHFFWIYEAMGRSFPYPEAVITSTLSLQKSGGLYKNHPFCIDLDGNFCLIRSYLQLPEDKRAIYKDRVYGSSEKNFEAIIHTFIQQPLEKIYNDSHGLPGALAALSECCKLPEFKYSDALKHWQNPLDKAWWL